MYITIPFKKSHKYWGIQPYKHLKTKIENVDLKLDKISAILTA